ncbi:MAG TPA: hypothetical protein VEB64_09485 [Azospirillaceae bacterium]|nr:hypothetical protein [Azospirillaceae bacterium]
MDTAIAPESVKPRLNMNIEMDDRTYLFPDGKLLSHVAISSDDQCRVTFDAVFVFNATCVEPRLWALDLEDAREFGRKLVDAYYQGKTQHVLSDGAKIAVVFNPNGFLIQFGDIKSPVELFIGASCIMRFVHGLLRVIDSVSPVLAH